MADRYIVMELPAGEIAAKRYALLPFSAHERWLGTTIFPGETHHEVTTAQLEAAGIQCSLAQSNKARWGGVAASIGFSYFIWRGTELQMHPHRLTPIKQSMGDGFSMPVVGLTVGVPLLAAVGLLAWRKYKIGELNRDDWLDSLQLLGQMASIVCGWHIMRQVVMEFSITMWGQAAGAGAAVGLGLLVANTAIILLRGYLDARHEASQNATMTEEQRSDYVWARVKESINADTLRFAAVGAVSAAVGFLLWLGATTLTAGVVPSVALLMYVGCAAVTGLFNHLIFNYGARPTAEAAKLTHPSSSESDAASRNATAVGDGTPLIFDDENNPLSFPPPLSRAGTEKTFLDEDEGSANAVENDEEEPRCWRSTIFVPGAA